MVRTRYVIRETHFSPQTQSADIISSPVTRLRFVKSSETNVLSVKCDRINENPLENEFPMRADTIKTL